MAYIPEIAFLFALISIADIQAQMIADNKPIRHFWWALLFGALIAGAWWLDGRNNWLAGGLLIEHFVFFSPALNFLRKPRKPFFYLSSSAASGALWDKVLLRVAPAYPYIWAAGLAGFIFLQFKL